MVVSGEGCRPHMAKHVYIYSRNSRRVRNGEIVTHGLPRDLRGKVGKGCLLLVCTNFTKF